MRISTFLGMLFLSGLLAACGSANNAPPVLGQLLDRIGGLGNSESTPSAAVIRATLTPQARARLGAPALLVTVPSRDTAALLIRVAVNGSVETYLSTDGISISVNNGSVVATRGLGFDLMRADALGGARNAGQAARRFDHLTGENKIITTTYNCSYRTNSAQQTVEACTSADLSFTNTYRKDGQGRMRVSTQWISPQIGSIQVEFYR